MKLLLSLLFLLPLACATTSNDVITDYEVVKGTISRPPRYDVKNDKPNFERIYIYLMVQDLKEDRSVILTAVVKNKEREDIIENLYRKIMEAPNEVLFLYGNYRTDEPWEEYLEGVNFEVVAVGVYVNNCDEEFGCSAELKDNYEIILTEYGERAMDAFRDISWGDFLKAIGEQGLDVVK